MMFKSDIGKKPKEVSNLPPCEKFLVSAQNPKICRNCKNEKSAHAFNTKPLRSYSEFDEKNTIKPIENKKNDYNIEVPQRSSIKDLKNKMNLNKSAELKPKSNQKMKIIDNSNNDKTNYVKLRTGSDNIYTSEVKKNYNDDFLKNLNNNMNFENKNFGKTEKIENLRKTRDYLFNIFYIILNFICLIFLFPLIKLFFLI